MCRDPCSLALSYGLKKTFLTALQKLMEPRVRRAPHAIAIQPAPVSCCLTVPAGRDEHARAKKKACAEAAGLGNDILMISEPEAAVTFALDGMNPHGFEVDSAFVLCHAGGGTVDLTSHTIQAPTPLLKVSEAVTGTGSMRRFSFMHRIAEYLKYKLSGLQDWDDNILLQILERFKHVVERKFLKRL